MLSPSQSWFIRSGGGLALAAILISFVTLIAWTPSSGEQATRTASTPQKPPQPELMLQSQAEVDQKSAGCVSCHQGIEPMHASPAVRLGCTDCHGGNSQAGVVAGSSQDAAAYDQVKKQAHVQPRHPEFWQKDGKPTSANPERTYPRLLKESAEFIRFINPGDLRIADQTCGSCHQTQVNATKKSPMTTSSIFWAAAGYANGILSTKHAIVGEAYMRDGEAAAIVPKTPPTEEELKKGVLPSLLPLPRWEALQPADNFRGFEDGGLLQPSAFPEIGNPNLTDDSGKPDIRLSSRGPGTGLRVSIPVLNLHKTRLNDPHLSLMGTNDHPGD